MEQQRQQQKHPRNPDAAVEDLAARLDAKAAERVLKRAIELHSDEQQRESYDLGLIGKVASELDIPPEYVAAAMAEELRVAATTPPRLIERMFVRDRIEVTRVAHEPAAAIDDRTKEWMSRHEGMRVAAFEDHATRWARDPSPVVAFKAGLKMQQGTGVLRDSRNVTTELRQLGDSTAVTVSADARVARAGAIAGASAGAIGLGVLNGVIWSGSILTWAIAALIGLVISLVVAVVATKAWASGVRNGLDRAATGITDPDALERHESVPEMLSRFREEWRQTRRDLRR